MELISREDALTLINDIRNRYMIMIENYARCIGVDVEKMQKDTYEDIKNRIDELPTIESRPECTWEVTSTFPIKWICSNCGTHYSERLTHKKHNYCAVCGAKSISKETIVERTSSYENNRKGKA